MQMFNIAGSFRDYLLLRHDAVSPRIAAAEFVRSEGDWWTVEEHGLVATCLECVVDGIMDAANATGNVQETALNAGTNEMLRSLARRMYRILSTKGGDGWTSVVDTRYNLVVELDKLTTDGVLEDVTECDRTPHFTERRMTSGRHWIPHWSSYDRCHDVSLGADDTITVKVHDGDMVNGSRIQLRHQWKLKGDWTRSVGVCSLVFVQWTKYVRDELVRQEYERMCERLAQTSSVLLQRG